MALAVGLLAASASGAVAQSAVPDPLAPAVVSGTLDTSRLIEEPGTRTAAAGNTVTQLRRGGFTGVTVAASDARLSGDLSLVYNEDEHQDPVASEFFAVQNGLYRITNPDGTWRGQMTGFSAGYDARSEDPRVNMDSVLLHGEGAYEGLTAYLLVDWKQEPASFEGAILPGEWPAEPSAR